MLRFDSARIRPCSAALITLLFAPLSHASCGSAYCLLNTSWDTQGVPATPGQWRLDMHVESINQDQLRAGKDNISAGQDLKCSANNLQGGWLALFIGSGMNVFGTIIDNKAPEETPLWYYGIWSGVSLSGIYMIIRSGSFTRRAGIKMDAKLLQ